MSATTFAPYAASFWLSNSQIRDHHVQPLPQDAGFNRLSQSCFRGAGVDAVKRNSVPDGECKTDFRFWASLFPSPAQCLMCSRINRCKVQAARVPIQHRPLSTFTPPAQNQREPLQNAHSSQTPWRDASNQQLSMLLPVSRCLRVGVGSLGGEELGPKQIYRHWHAKIGVQNTVIAKPCFLQLSNKTYIQSCNLFEIPQTQIYA
jgi:hypothetical protein